jgi:hypothetical protein
MVIAKIFAIWPHLSPLSLSLIAVAAGRCGRH